MSGKHSGRELCRRDFLCNSANWDMRQITGMVVACLMEILVILLRLVDLITHILQQKSVAQMPRIHGSVYTTMSFCKKQQS